VAWALARWLLGAVQATPLRRPTPPRLVLFVLTLVRVDPFARSGLRLPPGRGPPALLPSV
jgi:hypothetical protein